MSLLDSRLRASVVLAGFIVGIVACASGQRSIAATPPSAPPQTATVATDVPNLYEAQRQVDEYIRSGRYDKDVAKVIAAARAWLEERAKTAVKPAIVLDIDETSLSNWPAYRVNGWGRVVNGGCDLQQGPCGLRASQGPWSIEGDYRDFGARASGARARSGGVLHQCPSSEFAPGYRTQSQGQGYQWTGLILLPEARILRAPRTSRHLNGAR